MTAVKDTIAAVLAVHGSDHLVRQPSGWEVQCTCGEVIAAYRDAVEAARDAVYAARRFRAHVAAAIAAALAAEDRESGLRADAWDEAVQAMAWAIDNGPLTSALPYVRRNNPYRAKTETP